MGFLDDYVAASSHARAQKERAQGGSGAFSDAIALSALRRSVTSDIQASLASVTADIGRAIAEAGASVSETLTGTLQQQEQERRRYEEARSRLRATLLHEITVVIEEAKRACVGERKPSARELFSLWVRLRGCQAHCVAHGLDDAGLLRELSGCSSSILQHAQAQRLPSFEGVLAEMASLVDTLHSLVCLKAQLHAWPTKPLPDGNRQLAPAGLRDAIDVAHGNMAAFAARCRDVAPRLRSLVANGLLLCRADSGVFSEEFALFDGLRAPPEASAAAVAAAAFKPFQLQFQHDDPSSGITLLAWILAQDGGHELLAKETAGEIDGRLREMAAEKRKLLELIQQRATANLPRDDHGWKLLLAESPYVFPDIASLEFPVKRRAGGKRSGGEGLLKFFGWAGIGTLGFAVALRMALPSSPLFALVTVFGAGFLLVAAAASPFAAFSWWRRRQSNQQQSATGKDEFAGKIAAMRAELDQIASLLGGNPESAREARQLDRLTA